MLALFLIAFVSSTSALVYLPTFPVIFKALHDLSHILHPQSTFKMGSTTLFLQVSKGQAEVRAPAVPLVRGGSYHGSHGSSGLSSGGNSLITTIITAFIAGLFGAGDHTFDPVPDLSLPTPC